MKTLKTITVLALLALVTFASAPEALAETGTQSAGITNVIPAAGTNTVAGTAFDIRNQDRVGAMIVTVSAGTTTLNTYYAIQRSANGSDWETIPAINIAMPHVATQTNVWYTNFTDVQIGAAGYLRVKGVGNTNASAVTNTFYWTKKNIVPGTK